MFKVSKRKTVALAIIGCALFSCSRNPEVKRIIDGVVPTDSISMRQVEIGTELLMPENIFVVKDKLVIYQSKADNLFTVFPLPFTGHSYAAGRTGRGPDEFIRIDVRSIVPYGDVFKVADADGMLKEVAIDSGRVDVISKTKMNLNQPYNGAFEMKDCYINMNLADEKYEYAISDKKTGETEHHVFREIVDYLDPGDCLVINDTKVIPARLIGAKEETGAKIEVLLLKRGAGDVWETLVKPGRKAKPGTRISFGDGLLAGEVVDIVDEGNRLIRFEYEGIFEEILDQLGQMPLPPYITHQLKDKDRYNTVYAEHSGSAAAPTAGLHFTPELLEEISEKGVDIARVTLHVGLGTFRPVKVDDVENHHMHSEFYMIDEEAAEKINRAKESGNRVICVGTTSCRTVESAADEDGRLKACSGWTEIFIYPGYRFKILDALITNFHLPESTLIMLVSALAGKEHVLAAYEEAVRERYRFFSFGDAMFIV